MKIKKSGVYGIYLHNELVYVGQAKNLYKRYYEHRKPRTYNNPTYHTYNYPLYRSFRKYGLESFEFKCLHICDIEEMLKYEQEYYDKYKPKYNQIRPVANPSYNESVNIKQGLGKKLNSLTMKQIEDIRIDRFCGMSLSECFCKYSKYATNGQLEKIYYFDTFKHIRPDLKESCQVSYISNNAQGEKNPNSKLSNQDVKDIKHKYSIGMKGSNLAIEYQVHRTTIFRALKRNL
jgi:group I intron endonuclease